MTITAEQYQMTREEKMGGAEGQAAYTARIAALRREAAPAPTQQPVDVASVRETLERASQVTGMPVMPETFLQPDPTRPVADIPAVDVDDDTLKDIDKYISSAKAMAAGIPTEAIALYQPVLDHYAQQRGVAQEQLAEMQKRLAELGTVDLGAQYQAMIQELGGGEALSKIQELSPQVAAAQSELLATQQRKLAELDRLEQTHGPGAFKESRSRQIQREYAVIESGAAIKLEALASQLQAWQGNYDMARGMAMDMANLASSQLKMQYNVLNTLMTEQRHFYNSLREDERIFITDLRDYYQREADLQINRTSEIANLYISAIEHGVDLGWTPAMIEDFAATDENVTRAITDYGNKVRERPAEVGWRDFTDVEKRKLEGAEIDWGTPEGYQRALDFLYEKKPTPLTSTAINRLVALSRTSEAIPGMTEDEVTEIASMLRAGYIIPEDPTTQAKAKAVLDEMLKETSLEASLEEAFKNLGLIDS